MEKELSLAQVLQIEMDIQTEIHNFCQAHGIKYYLWAGSLLGAVRHNGFIPWDDDMDIIMPRKDFEYFAENFNSERYGVQSCATVKSYPYVHAKAYDKRTKKVEASLRADSELQIGVDVDIFVMDDSDFPIGKNTPDRKRMLLRYLCMSSLASFEKGNRIRNIAVFIVQKVLRMKANTCALRMDRHSQKQTGGKHVMLSSDCNLKQPLVMQRDWFGEPVLHTFENTQYNIPQNYDAILTACYGDYMQLPPEDKRVAHHGFTAYLKENV